MGFRLKLETCFALRRKKMLIPKDNSRSSLNPNHIDYRTKNFQKKSLLTLLPWWKIVMIHAGKKVQRFILSPTPFASPPFSRDAHVVFAHAAAWPHFCWSQVLIRRFFLKNSVMSTGTVESDTLTISCLEPEKIHLFINGWLSIG